MGDVPSMNNLADLCRECELPSKTRELEEENRALKEALAWACNRLHQWSPWNNGCHFKACGECPLKGYAKEESK